MLEVHDAGSGQSFSEHLVMEVQRFFVALFRSVLLQTLHLVALGAPFHKDREREKEKDKEKEKEKVSDFVGASKMSVREGYDQRVSVTLEISTVCVCCLFGICCSG